MSKYPDDEEWYENRIKSGDVVEDTLMCLDGVYCGSTWVISINKYGNKIALPLSDVRGSVDDALGIAILEVNKMNSQWFVKEDHALPDYLSKVVSLINS